MKIKNFEILFTLHSSISIAYEGEVYDLHNYGDFLGFRYDAVEHLMTMEWNASAYPPTPHAIYFTLVFSAVTYLEVTERDSAMPLNEDTILDSLSYMSSTDMLRNYLEIGTHPVTNPEESDKNGDHLLFCFRGGQMIRIGADSASIIGIQTISEK